MIYYNPGTWSVAFALTLKGSVFPKSSAWAFPCAFVAGMINMGKKPYFYFFYFGATGTWTEYNEALSHIEAWRTVLAGFTTILGFLIALRAQRGYDRWWEGGTLLQQLRGEWFNAYSSLLAFCTDAPEKRAEVRKFQHMLARQTSLLYACALQQVATMTDKTFQLLDIDGFDRTSLQVMQDSHDKCEVVLQWIQRSIVDAARENIVTIAPPILSRVYNQLGTGIVNLNNARKITEFPIPFPLAQMLAVMLWFHWLLTAMVAASVTEDPATAALLAFVVVISFQSVNYIAVELEMPFGDDPNDLPLGDMMRDLNASLKSLLQEYALKPPKYEFNEDRDSRLMSMDVDFDQDIVETLSTQQKRDDHYNRTKYVKQATLQFGPWLSMSSKRSDPMKASASRDSTPDPAKRNIKTSVQDQEGSIRWVVSGASEMTQVSRVSGSDMSRVSGVSSSGHLSGSPARHSKPIPPVIEEDPERRESEVSLVSRASASTARHSKPISPVIEEDPDRPTGVTFSKSTVTEPDDVYRPSTVHTAAEDVLLDAGSSDPEARLMRLSTQIERHLSSIVAELGALATLKQDVPQPLAQPPVPPPTVVTVEVQAQPPAQQHPNSDPERRTDRQAAPDLSSIGRRGTLELESQSDDLPIVSVDVTEDHQQFPCMCACAAPNASRRPTSAAPGITTSVS